MMDVQFANYNGINGVLLSSFVNVEKERSYTGADLMDGIVPDFDAYDLSQYTLENIMLALEPYSFEREFVQIIFFDSLIANQDRHSENWSIIEFEDRVRFAPIYDNGASLGFNNSEDQVLKILKNPEMLKGFVNRGKACVGMEGERKKPKIGKLLTRIEMLYPEFVKVEMERVNCLQKDDVVGILNDIPTEIMADCYKEWVIYLIREKQCWLNKWYRER